MNKKARILIVDDEKEICWTLLHLLEKNEFEGLAVHDGPSALQKILTYLPDVVLLDFRLPGMDGLEVLKTVKKLDPDLPVIMITGYADVRGAVELMKAGAYDYLAKPFEHPEIVSIVHKAVSEKQCRCKSKNLSSQFGELLPLSKLMGSSSAISQIMTEVNRVATSDFAVTICGDTGSGKELIARAIHHASDRAGGSFVAIDCGAICDTLLENELFGHEKGSFTGAISQQPGKFEEAKGGTLFLDEVTNMSLNSQAKFLRVLQEKKYCRVGGTKAQTINVRILVASNQDLAAAVASGSFREDLFYRLNEFAIRIPSLRERKQDIPFLANRFRESTNNELAKTVRGFTDSAMEGLIAHDWPGNVRQFRATIRRAVLMAEEEISMKHLDFTHSPFMKQSLVSESEQNLWLGSSLKQIVQKRVCELEREVLVRVLRHTGANKAKAARLLHIDYKTIHSKIKQLGISTGE